MEKREDFITIGELSKLTGVNAKSLRYYEKIGILRPAYIDSENGYRYYTYSQIPLANAAQFYVGMDIPLKEINHFINTDSGVINCRDQIVYGIEIAKQKIQTIQNQLAYSERILSEIERFDKVIASKEPIRLTFPSKNCILFPLVGKMTRQRYYSTRYRLLLELQKAGFHFWYEAGLLYRYNGHSWEEFIFIDVGQFLAPTSQFSISPVPSGDYICKLVDFFDVEPSNLCGSLCPDKETDFIMLSELFPSTLNYKDSKFMLRWLA